MPQSQNETVAIRNLQRYLRQLSYHNAAIPAPPIDGIFERDTEAALRAFQEERELPVTGVADPVTWEELYTNYRASLAEHTPPSPMAVFPFQDPPAVLREGTRGFAVAALRHMLRELSAHYDALEGIEVDERYDDAVTAAVRDFQARNRIPVTGEVDPYTWNTITDQYNIRFAIEPFL